ncbi:hypothetical protein [Gelidibacter gilvus]|uniref:Uncharacterized protein n=1 Tax=Gelidibacter gilvus TaxID=59602 RepID=A0A4Q0XEJ5_9FLAO|nr:hypothetical protein [Gelidibacter gilvus]RXJ49578.1 hypothetical protein ESZ48_11235 [Gelidibacter gilvus]
MAKKKFDPSWFFNVEKIEDLKKLGDNSDVKDYTNVFMDILKTPILLRTMARIIEKDEKLPLKMMAKEVKYRMMQILNEEESSGQTLN